MAKEGDCNKKQQGKGKKRSLEDGYLTDTTVWKEREYSSKTPSQKSEGFAIFDKFSKGQVRGHLKGTGLDGSRDGPHR